MGKSYHCADEAANLNWLTNYVLGPSERRPKPIRFPIPRRIRCARARREAIPRYDRRAALRTTHPATASLTGVTIHSFACEPISPHLMQMIRDGGLLPHLEKRLPKA